MEKIQEYIETVETLSEIIKEENKILSELKFETSGDLLERKTKAVTLYKEGIVYLNSNIEKLNSLPKADKEYIKEISLNINNLIKDNESILRTKMEVSQSVMNSIISLLKTSNISNSTSYGSMGTLNPLEKSKNAITINETL